MPGVPLVESPLFDAMIEELKLTPEERTIAIDLNVRGYAVIDFPDGQLDARIERIKEYLASRRGIMLSTARQKGGDTASGDKDWFRPA